MAGHPLRPATDHRLGEPLPHQQANRARAPPPTPLRALISAIEIAGMLCGISPAFAGLSPIEGQVTHVLRTRAPCAHPLYCYRGLRTRLACVRHAASVRSEPGSNSRLKLVVWKTKKSDKGLPCRTQVFQTNFLSLGLLNYRTGSGTYHPIVKEQASCPAGRLSSNRSV